MKILMAIDRSPTLAQYRRSEKILRALPTWAVQLGIGVHVGWAVEGAVGSSHKLDATYLGPHVRLLAFLPVVSQHFFQVNIAARLESSTKQYGVSNVLSGAFVSMLSAELKDLCRPLDVVMVKGSSRPIELFTVDIHFTSNSVPSKAPKAGSTSSAISIQGPDGVPVAKLHSPSSHGSLTSPVSKFSTRPSFSSVPYFGMRRASEVSSMGSMPGTIGSSLASSPLGSPGVLGSPGGSGRAGRSAPRVSVLLNSLRKQDSTAMIQVPSSEMMMSSFHEVFVLFFCFWCNWCCAGPCSKA
jgi:hypothetical protein